MTDNPQPYTGLRLDYAAAPAGVRRRQLRVWLTLCGLVLGAFGAGSILLPSLNRPRCEYPSRLKCASNLRQIGQGCQMYANENHGQFPPDFKALLLTQDLTSEIFVCYRTTDERATGPTTQAVADQLSAGGHLSFVYTGRGMDWKTPLDAVVAYEPLANHGDGANVLFADGSVQWLDAFRMTRLLVELNSGHNPPRRDHMP